MEILNCVSLTLGHRKHTADDVEKLLVYLDGQIHEAMTGILMVRGKEAKYELVTKE